MAVLPTPGSPTRTGLFLVRRERIWITRRISSSRPMTGSSFPARASSVRSLRVLLERPGTGSRPRASRRAAPPRISLARRRSARAVAPAARSASPAAPFSFAAARSTCSVETYSSLSLFASCSAWSSDLQEPGAGVRLCARDARQRARSSSSSVRDHGRWRSADLLQQRPGDAVLLLEQGEQQVLDVDRLVVAAARLGLGRLQGLLGLQGELLVSHECNVRLRSALASPWAPLFRKGGTSSRMPPRGELKCDAPFSEPVPGEPRSAPSSRGRATTSLRGTRTSPSWRTSRRGIGTSATSRGSRSPRSCTPTPTSPRRWRGRSWWSSPCRRTPCGRWRSR